MGMNESVWPVPKATHLDWLFGSDPVSYTFQCCSVNISAIHLMAKTVDTDLVVRYSFALMAR